IKGLGVGAGEPEHMARVSRAQDRVASHPQDVHGQREYLRVVIDHEDRFGWLRRWGSHADLGRSTSARKPAKLQRVTRVQGCWLRLGVGCQRWGLRRARW